MNAVEARNIANNVNMKMKTSKYFEDIIYDEIHASASNGLYEVSAIYPTAFRMEVIESFISKLVHDGFKVEFHNASRFKNVHTLRIFWV
jgi:hypothetical protein